MNNYLKLLNELNKFAGDGIFHDIHDYLNDMGFLDNQKKTSFLRELSLAELIYFDGGRKGGEIIIGTNNSMKTFGGFHDKRFEARITLKGVEYLKKNLSELEKENFGVNLNGSGNQVIINSSQISISNSNNIDKLIDEIKLKISDDLQISNDKKEVALRTTEKFYKEYIENNLAKSTISDFMQLGGNISSIGSLILSILQQTKFIG